MSNSDNVTIKKIGSKDFITLTRQIIGLPVSRTWRGYGTAIFFELGKLSEHRKRRDGSISLWGEVTIDLEIGWRVERKQSIYFGSSSGHWRINNCLDKLQGLKIVNITLQGRLPELIVELSNGIWLHSFSTWEGQPDWTLFFNNYSPNRQWLFSKRGNIILATSND